MELLKGKPTTARELSGLHEGILSMDSVAEQLIGYSLEVQLLYWWQTDDTQKILTWLKVHPPVTGCRNLHDFGELRAQLYGQLALGEVESARQRVEAELARFDDRPASEFRLERFRLLLLNIAILMIQGDEEGARMALLDILADLQTYQIVASLLYLRQWIMPLFEQLPLGSLPEEQVRYVEQVLILYKQRNTSSRRGEQEVPDGLLALGISRKEWRVLQFIMDGKNNDDIAQSMFIAVSTVKTHINNLYKKLAVTHRKAAIARGRALSGGADGE